jgi:hypothetical protein
MGILMTICTGFARLPKDFLLGAIFKVGMALGTSKLRMPCDQGESLAVLEGDNLVKGLLLSMARRTVISLFPSMGILMTG